MAAAAGGRGTTNLQRPARGAAGTISLPLNLLFAVGCLVVFLILAAVFALAAHLILLLTIDAVLSEHGIGLLGLQSRNLIILIDHLGNLQGKLALDRRVGRQLV